jgi:hypothetical protein
MDLTNFTQLLYTFSRAIALPIYPSRFSNRTVRLGPYRIDLIGSYKRVEHESHIAPHPQGGHYVFHHIYKNGGTDFVSRTYKSAKWKMCAFRQGTLASCAVDEAPGQVHLTTLRDPVQRFFSGVAEAKRRNDLPANASYAAIIVRLQTGDFLNTHLYPQALFLVHPRTGRLYNVSRVVDIDSYLWARNNPRIVQRHASARSHAGRAVPEALLSAEHIKALCKIYRVDYDLFNYRLPRACFD